MSSLRSPAAACAGDIFSIPLFVSDKPPLTIFSDRELSGPDKLFAFMRVIHNTGGGGFIIEIFDITGPLETPLDEILKSPRLFRPVAVTGLAIRRKRWRKRAHQDGFDPERDSAFSQIELVTSPYDDPQLWRGGVKYSVSSTDVDKYEHWDLWGAHMLERRILRTLEERRSGRRTETPAAGSGSPRTPGL